MFPTFPFDLSLSNFWLPAFPAVVSGAVAPTSQVNPCETLACTPNIVTLAEAYTVIADQTRQRLQARQATPCIVPSKYASRTSTNGKFQLVAEAWQLHSHATQVAELRLVKIDGAKSNIINAWVFPAQPTQVPVFAAELIGVSDVTRVAFIDIQVPVVNQTVRQCVQHKTKPLAERYANLPCDEAAPQWATCDSAGNFTYARGVTGPDNARISACYFDYLDCYLSEFLGSAPSIDQADPKAAERLQAYQLHHMEHSPGKKFLGNLFGHDWTHTFMTNFLFAKMEKKS